MNMKKIIFLCMAVVALAFTSCQYDNYDAPSLNFHGKLTYNGDNFLYDGNPGRRVFNIFQTGFGKTDNGTNIRVDETGAFQQLLFSDDDYKLTLENRKFPFEFEDFTPRAVGYDSLTINLQKNMERNFAVTPYYTVTNFTTTYTNNNIVLKCKVAKVSGTKQAAPAVVKARAYVSTSALVNSGTVCQVATDISITDQGDVEVSVPLSSYRSSYVNNFRTYAFCRIAIELANIPDYYLFSDIVKIEGLPE